MLKYHSPFFFPLSNFLYQIFFIIFIYNLKLSNLMIFIFYIKLKYVMFVVALYLLVAFPL